MRALFLIALICSVLALMLQSTNARASSNNSSVGGHSSFVRDRRAAQGGGAGGGVGAGMGFGFGVGANMGAGAGGGYGAPGAQEDYARYGRK